jgi:hypothetical protein
MVLIGLNVEEECWLEIKSVLFKFLKGHTLHLLSPGERTKVRRDVTGVHPPPNPLA